MDTETGKPGRPEVGNLVNVRLGALQDAVDTYSGDRISRAEAIRRLIELGLDSIADRTTERHAALDEAYEVVKDLPADAPLHFADHIEDRLYRAVPVLAILRNCAKASYEMDLDEHGAANPDGLVDLLIDESEQTKLFDQAHDAALRAFIFGRRV